LKGPKPRQYLKELLLLTGASEVGPALRRRTRQHADPDPKRKGSKEEGKRIAVPGGTPETTPRKGKGGSQLVGEKCWIKTSHVIKRGRDSKCERGITTREGLQSFPKGGTKCRGPGRMDEKKNSKARAGVKTKKFVYTPLAMAQRTGGRLGNKKFRLQKALSRGWYHNKKEKILGGSQRRSL